MPREKRSTYAVDTIKTVKHLADFQMKMMKRVCLTQDALMERQDMNEECHQALLETLKDNLIHMINEEFEVMGVK